MNLTQINRDLADARQALEDLIDDPDTDPDNEEAYNSLDDALMSVEEAITYVLRAEDEFDG